MASPKANKSSLMAQGVQLNPLLGQNIFEAVVTESLKLYEHSYMPGTVLGSCLGG